MAKTMVFRSVDGSDYRVSVQKTSVNGLAALVKFFRIDRYRPVWAGDDGTAWVESGKLHFVAGSDAKVVADKGSVTRTGVTAKTPPKARTRRTPVTPEFSSAKEVTF